MPIRAINHLAFITPDLPKTIRFYRDLLGMQLFAGVGHDGYRHYFLRFGDNQVAFFEYEGASVMEKKFPGVRTDKPLGFDHVSFTVDSCEELFEFKDRLEAAGVEVYGAVDHGTIWSIYFYDPNGIPLELSWELMEVIEPPAVAEDAPMPIVAEGSEPQPGQFPTATRRTPPEEWKAKSGNGHVMRETFLREGKGRLTPEGARVLAAQK
jgi:catechol 2,3-dioxygenase-like lactoylglutathione lyase family enzyme